MHTPKPLGDITEAMSSFYIQSVVWSHVVGVLEVSCVSRDVDTSCSIKKKVQTTDQQLLVKLLDSIFSVFPGVWIFHGEKISSLILLVVLDTNSPVNCKVLTFQHSARMPPSKGIPALNKERFRQ